MTELLLEIFGWLGYLERPLVLVQLGLVVAVVLLTRQARQRHWLPALPLLAYPPLGLLVLALGCLALAGLGLSQRLASLLGLLWLGWYGISLLHQPLARWLPAQQLHELEARLLRPAYLVAAALLLIGEVDNVNDLAVIRLGELLGVSMSFGKLFNALVVVYLVLVGCGPPAAGVAWLIQRSLGLSDGSRKAMELMLRYLVVGLGLVGVAMHLGINSTALIAVAGGLSVGLGFGIKEVFSNFVSGLWLLFEGSVRPGEVLMLDGDPCEVRRLGLRAATLWRSRDNVELVVPNQIFFTDTTTTYTGSDRMRRSEVLVGAAYRHDPDAVIALLEQVARAHPRVLAEPAPKALLLQYGESSIDYGLRFWIANPMRNSDISSEVRRAIWHAFQERGIEFPFPQRVLTQASDP